MQDTQLMESEKNLLIEVFRFTQEKNDIYHPDTLRKQDIGYRLAKSGLLVEHHSKNNGSMMVNGFGISPAGINLAKFFLENEIS